MKQEKLEQRLQICKDFAIKEHEGLCLATEYINSKTKMPWRCKEGHEWDAHWNNIKSKKWCPICAFNIPTIEDLQNFAIKEHNGFCKSMVYINAHTKYLWQCKEGHEWMSKYTNIKSGEWCRVCANNIKRISIKIILERIKDRELELISTNYIKSSTSLKWKCKICNYEWLAAWNSIYSGSGCPNCAGKIKLTIEEIKERIKNKSFELTSTNYINANTPLEWKCKICNNEWASTYGNIYNGTGCPNCSSFKHEKQCRELLENKLGHAFNKTRFYYGDQLLEFDGYNYEHKVAFEYHGIQHYEYPNYFHKTPKAFNEQQRRDDLKEQYCAERDIKLLIIPYTENDNLENYINNLSMEN
jgi:DNA-directed RNA polymerase subunit RPC12/RpoP